MVVIIETTKYKKIALIRYGCVPFSSAGLVNRDAWHVAFQIRADTFFSYSSIFYYTEKKNRSRLITLDLDHLHSRSFTTKSQGPVLQLA